MRNYKLNCIAGGIFAAVASFFIVHTASAQVNPMLGMYYQNRYLSNPAYAGAAENLTVNLAYKREWTKVEGTPATNNITADYGFGKVGVGLNINNDKDGLIDINRYAVTYAYHLPVNDQSTLSFGLSAGVTTEKINTGNITGDAGDAQVDLYNDQTAHLDGDFGAYYTWNDFTLQAVLPNLRKLLNEEDEDERVYTPSTFYTALSYKFTGKVAAVEPMVVYRGVKNYDNIIDAGVNAAFFGNQFNLMAMYHSTKNASFGAGFEIQKKYQLQLAYTAPVSGTLRKYSSGSVQVGLKMSFLEK